MQNNLIKCRQCAKCCKALGALELVNEEDIKRFGKEVLGYKDGKCEYLKNNKCSIHETKPQICKYWYCDTHPIKKKKYELGGKIK